MSQTGSKIFLLCVLSMLHSCVGLANNSVYIIQNSETHKCLSSGPIINIHDSKITLFKRGLIVSKNCSNSSNLLTVDFGQQWMVHLVKECKNGTTLSFTHIVINAALILPVKYAVSFLTSTDPRNFSYQIQLVLRNAYYTDPQLNATLRGEFIKYFPDPIKLQGHHPLNSSTQSQEFSMADSLSNHCLVDDLENNATDLHFSENNASAVSFLDCNNTNLRKSQMWNFILVNEKEIVHTYK